MGEDSMTQVLQRLSRIEADQSGMRKALEKMVDTNERLAITEERITTVLTQNSVLFRKIEKLESDVAANNITNATQSQSIGLFERLGWIIITAIAGVIGWIFKT